MTIYYVDSNATQGGSNDGSTWALAYADLATALAGDVTTDSVVHVAHNHSREYPTAQALTFPSGVVVRSINSGTDLPEKAVAKQEYSTVNGRRIDLQHGAATSKVMFEGLWFSSGDGLGLGGGQDNGVMTFRNCSLAADYWGKYMTLGQYQEYTSVVLMDRCDIYLATSSNSFGLFVEGGTHKIVNSIIKSGTVLASAYAHQQSVLHIINSDLSALEGTPYLLLTDNSAEAAQITIHRCKLPATWGINSSAGIYELDITESGSGDDYHYFYHSSSHWGEVEEDTTTYLNATYDGTNGFSVLMSGNANTKILDPVRYKLCTLPAQDLTSSKTITVEMQSDTQLTQENLWIELVQNDATDHALGASLTTQPSDVFGTTNHTDVNTAGWSGTAQTYQYSISKATTVVSDLDADSGTIEVWVCLGANADVNVDPAVTVT